MNERSDITRNPGLKAGQYRYFIADGASAAQLAEYDRCAARIAERARLFVEEQGAQKAELKAGFGMRVIGLVFLHEIPPGWKPRSNSLMADADTSLRAGQESVGRMSRMRWHNPHHYLGAPFLSGEDKRPLFVLARRHGDKWLIASPVGAEGKSFTPVDAKEISLAEYGAMIGAGDDSPSPSEDEAYDHPVMHQYPFVVKEENKARYETLKSEWEKAGISSVRVREPSFRDRQRDRHPWLGYFGL